GGSTGSPINLYVNRDRKCSQAAAALRHNGWAGWEVGHKAAVLWGAPRDRPGSSWRHRLREFLLRKPLWLDTGHITPSALEAFHEALLAYRPRVLQAYARSLVLFARYLEERGLLAHRPRALVTSAEVLEAEDRALVERVFGCPVF